MNKKYISVFQYCKKNNKKKQQVYLDIRLGKLKHKLVKKTVNRIMVLDN
jgi:hypothetical protein